MNDDRIFISKKDLIGVNYTDSRAMRRLLEDPKIAEILQTPQERRDFFKELKKHRGGGLTKGETENILAKWRYGVGDRFTPKEARDISKAMGLGKILPSERPKPSYVPKAPPKSKLF